MSLNPLTWSGDKVKKLSLKTEILYWQTQVAEALNVMPLEGVRTKMNRYQYQTKGRTEG